MRRRQKQSIAVDSPAPPDQRDRLEAGDVKNRPDEQRPLERRLGPDAKPRLQLQQVRCRQQRNRHRQWTFRRERARPCGAESFRVFDQPLVAIDFFDRDLNPEQAADIRQQLPVLRAADEKLQEFTRGELRVSRVVEDLPQHGLERPRTRHGIQIENGRIAGGLGRPGQRAHAAGVRQGDRDRRDKRRGGEHEVARAEAGSAQPRAAVVALPGGDAGQRHGSPNQWSFLMTDSRSSICLSRRSTRLMLIAVSVKSTILE